MATVRPCEILDIDAVADLFMRVFRRTDVPAPASLRGYLAELYLANPWTDAARPPLLAVDDRDAPIGFLGALPIPLRWQGRKYDTTVGGSLMVDPRSSDSLAAVQLLRRFLEAPQDLAFTDTANPVAARFWQGLGGHLAHFQGMRWMIVLRPTTLGIAMAVRHGRRRWMQAARPLSGLVDRTVARRLRPPPADAVLRRATVADLYDVLTGLGDGHELMFGGTLDEFAWLIDMLHRRTRFGPLETMLLEADGSAVGAVVYFPNRRGLAQVVLASAARGRHGQLIAALAHDAASSGSAGIMGHADARLAMELRELPSVYLYRNDFTVLHARDPQLVNALRSGDAAMSRITGEWWTRLQGDAFS